MDKGKDSNALEGRSDHKGSRASGINTAICTTVQLQPSTGLSRVQPLDRPQASLLLKRD